ncbi:DUF956 family protein [Trichococcus pasteurii]|uniref:Uncharacterized protein n=1 Tax=Trichococcus pasteurii TaxID=43064 RepID=A0A1W1ICD9_9LACT|nr:DUF956 family protein [Trichococcus pasteurii]SFE27115.1 hypothetical protein SAMN04488086_102219 [Trichococcus pasteurii]SLM50539.1 Hypothetical protein TPAS_211 [Trichococcus pasteurii]SSB91420.1 Hypothetical protein TPAS_211 [Trichococcus pasteurii]
MVESLNTKVDMAVDGTSYMGLTDYGKIMIGDKAFEFYHHRDPRKFIQIPWEEVDYVLASVMFKGKWIPRFALQTKKDGTYTFSAKNPKDVLRAIRLYVSPDHMVQSLGFFDVLKNAFKHMFKKKAS